MYYFIVNPASGNGNGEKVWKKLERRFWRIDTEYEVFLTAGRGDAKRLSASLSSDVQSPCTLVVVGGDGTMNEVIDGLQDSPLITLGHIPTGLCSGFARSLHLPKNPARGLRQILRSRRYLFIRYGIAGYGEECPVYRRFIVSSGIGLDAAVCHEMLEQNRKRKYPMLKGKFPGFLKVVLKQLFLIRPVKGYLLLDGVKKVEYNHIYFIATHIRPFGHGAFRFGSRLKGEEGELEVCVLHGSSKVNLLPVLFGALFGNIKNRRGVRFYRCRELTVHLERPMPVHVDGESCLCQTDVQLRCMEKKIKIIA